MFILEDSCVLHSEELSSSCYSFKSIDNEFHTKYIAIEKFSNSNIKILSLSSPFDKDISISDISFEKIQDNEEKSCKELDDFAMDYLIKMKKHFLERNQLESKQISQILNNVEKYLLNENRDVIFPIESTFGDFTKSPFKPSLNIMVLSFLRKETLYNISKEVNLVKELDSMPYLETIFENEEYVSHPYFDKKVFENIKKINKNYHTNDNDKIMVNVKPKKIKNILLKKFKSFNVDISFILRSTIKNNDINFYWETDLLSETIKILNVENKRFYSLFNELHLLFSKQRNDYIIYNFNIDYFELLYTDSNVTSISFDNKFYVLYIKKEDYYVIFDDNYSYNNIFEIDHDNHIYKDHLLERLY